MQEADQDQDDDEVEPEEVQDLGVVAMACLSNILSTSSPMLSQ